MDSHEFPNSFLSIQVFKVEFQKLISLLGVCQAC